MKQTINELSKLLKPDNNFTGDYSFYGVVQSEIRDGDDKVTGYNVRVGESLIEARKLAGANIGDVVLCTTLSNGVTVISGTLDGDKDAVHAGELAEETNNYFWFTSTDTGFGKGVHVTQKPQSEVLTDPTNAGGNLLARSNGITVRDGLEELASFSTDAVIGKIPNGHAKVTSDGLEVWKGVETNDSNKIASFGTTARIGAASNKHVTIDSNGMTYYKGSETEANKVAVFGSDIALYRGNKSVVIGSRGIDLTGTVYAEGDIVAGGSIDLGDSGRIYMPNNYAIHAMHALSDTTDPLIFISQSDNIVIGSEDWNDCYIHCVYSPQSGTSSLIPNVRITDAHRLTRTTHANSSARFKHDIKDVENKELDPHNLYDIEVKQFRYNDDVITDPKDCRYNKELIGFIAEQVRDVYPVAVDINENGECEAWSPQYIVPPMLALLQEQHKEIDELKAEIAKLSKKGQ